MTKLSSIFKFFLLITLFSSCKFDLFDDIEYNYPLVVIENITQNFDTTFVQINATRVGEPIELVGLDYKIDGSAFFKINQQLLIVSEGIYQFPLVDLDPEQEYIFKAFAGNGYAYGESELSNYTVPLVTPIIPCELTDNVIQFNGLTQTINSISFDEGDSEYSIRATSNNLSIRITFSQPPTSDTYTTTTGSLQLVSGLRLVSVDVLSPAFRPIKDFETVYVEKKGENQYSITFCELDTQNNNTMILRGNVQL